MPAALPERADAVAPWIDDVVRRATYLWERQARPGVPGNATPVAAQRRAERWQALLAPAGSSGLDAWRRRLRLAGLGEPRALALLAEPPAGRACWPDWPSPSGDAGAGQRAGGVADRPLPPRARDPLASPASAVAAMAGALRESDAGRLDEPDPLLAATATCVPFAHLLAPLVRLAGRCLDRGPRGGESGRTWARTFDPAAHRSHERALLVRLATVAGPTLQHEFERGLSEGERLLRRLAPLPAAPGGARYAAFVERLRSDGGAALFRRYPVLARLLATVLAQWRDSTQELCARLDEDRAALARHFGGATPGALDRVVRVRASMSDAHRGGRSTLMLTFEDGLVLLYKPKSLAQDRAFQALLDWCERAGAPWAMKHPTVLDRGTHGWSSFVSHEACADAEAQARFYRRAGQLLALLHLLRGTDAHVENVIAHGEYPVLVDTETLCHPELRGDLGFAAADAASESVRRTGLLPAFDGPQSGTLVADSSGLATWPADGWAEPVPAWQAINTDAMHLRTERQRPCARNAPRAQSAPATPGRLEAEVIEGFEAMMRFLERQRAALRAPDGPLAPWASLPVRHVLRDTQVYADVMHLGLQPGALVDGVDFSIEMERLAVAYLAAPTDAQARSRVAQLLHAELRACGRLDVPMFTACTDGLALDDGSGLRVESVLRATACSELAAQVERLGESERTLQCEAIRASFAARRAWCQRRAMCSEHLEAA